MPRLLLLVTIAVAGCAAPRTAADRPAVALDHAAIHVADLDRSVAFYRDLFGLAEMEAPGDPAVIRWLDLGDAELHLIAFDGPVPPTTKAVHFALRVPDVGAVAERAAALDVAYSDWPGAPATVSTRPDGVRQIYVQDPDGYWIEVNDAR